MKWWVFLLLPFSLLAQESYFNCEDLTPQNYQVSYDADKVYYWDVSGGYIISNTGNSITVQWPDLLGTYAISVYATRFGCVGDTSYHEVIIKECQYLQLFFPNTFTPNGDNYNEAYQIGGKFADKIEHIIIYNRWGEKVFEVDGNVPWNGEDCQAGLYMVSVFVNNNRYIRSITLVK